MSTFSAEALTARLYREILSDRHPAGTCLGTAAELARGAGISEALAREALAELRANSLVEVFPDGTARVKDWRRSAELTVLPLYFQHAPRSAEKSRLAEELLHARKVVLAEAAAWAAERASEADLLDLRELVVSMRDCRGDTTSLLELDRSFLTALVASTHSLPMRWMANSFFRVYDQVIRALPNIWALPPDHFAFLDELLAALEAKDPEETALIVRRHLDRTDPLISALIRFHTRTGALAPGSS